MKTIFLALGIALMVSACSVSGENTNAIEADSTKVDSVAVVSTDSVVADSSVAAITTTVK